ncbi:signal recognition particle-docking protein FtsY [Albimonas donghaensis]|uniref:Signal recognition particle receptor FtsY n=1 Tax=Albimonas donghaensis TaxID=356660 RepID=A0A1H3A6Z3_9RHOB|nr:signal recognition particle-docking protein FtsY [Albimonas donghaensis]SDX25078.1 signal recognition particle-docking protein FtsY [Albimonas donghaensis]
MSFFSKLKSRLTKSSSRLDQGLDALMETGEPEAPEAAAPAPVAEPTPEPQPAPRAEPAPAPAPRTEPAPLSTPVSTPEPAPAPAPQAEAPKRGFFSRLIGGGGEPAPGAATSPPSAPRAPERKRVLDDDLLEQLEELLISADLGVDAALRVSANLAEGRFGRRVGASEIKALLAEEVARVLEPVARPLPLTGLKPQVVLVVGVNGSGKTTTIGKLAMQLRGAGKSVMIAAGDTFRAAAVEQLQVWGERAGVPVMTAPQGSDPASLAFDALTRAQDEGADLLLIDTAGRLQNRADLMAELEKIVRVIRKKDPTAPHDTLLVLDATVGQNALSQVELFRKAADVTGLVMTKLDGTAKGGVLVALADRFGLPIHAIGVGESIEDLAPFDPEEFARALVGMAGPEDIA